MKLFAGSADTPISSIGLRLDKSQVLQLSFRQVKGKLYLSILKRNESNHALTSMAMVLIFQTLLRHLMSVGRTMLFLTIS
jgi:hypothetical protein